MNDVELDIPDEEVDEDAIIEKRRKEREELLKVWLVWMRACLSANCLLFCSHC